MNLTKPWSERFRKGINHVGKTKEGTEIKILEWNLKGTVEDHVIGAEKKSLRNLKKWETPAWNLDLGNIYTRNIWEEVERILDGLRRTEERTFEETVNEHEKTNFFCMQNGRKISFCLISAERSWADWA